MNLPVRLAIVGMGARSEIYAREALVHPDRLTIVGVADINPDKVRAARETYGFSQEHCFATSQELAAAPKFADGIINGTMDPQHVETTLPLLHAGYDVLLEKPFALNQPQADELLACAKRTGRKVMVCHVLRYAPFYREIKELLLSGALGRVMNLQMTEQVSYFHQSVSYVRGKYASPEICGSGMLLSKCSHDLDLLAWLMADTRPTTVASIGSAFQYHPDMAPEGAGTHCLLHCAVERDCLYSAKRLYIEHPQRWAQNIWHELGCEGTTRVRKLQLLSEPDNPYSRCVYRCEPRIVDHQSVLVGFQNGATATFSMNGGASAPQRSLHITGTRGEVYGCFEENRFTVSLIDPTAPGGRRKHLVRVSPGDAHGGGDQALVADFIALLRGTPPSVCCTTLNDSMVGHRLAFLAEDSREQGGQALPY